MNLTNFLKQIDNLTANYSAAQLESFIHELGRILPEGYREDFLKRLRAKSENEEPYDTDSNHENIIHTAFDEQYISVKEELDRIEEEELCISAVLNEIYDEWYDNDEDEFFYKDEDDISGILKKACIFVHRCTDEEKYAEGLEIGRILFSMQIICSNEDYGDEDFSISNMIEHELLDYDFKKLALDTLYCVYQAVPLPEKPEVLYEIIMNAGNNKITLEDLMQCGDDELPEFSEFLPAWTKYLGEKSGRAADQLFVEAVGLQNDIQIACSYADEYLKVHPGLYLHILENNPIENTIVDIGLKAIQKIPVKYVVRSAVALKTAEYAIAAGKSQDVLEICYYSAYESDTNTLGYLRALLHGFDSAPKREQLRQKIILSAAPKNTWNYFGSYSDSERKENGLDKNEMLLLQFFDGQFAEVLSKGLNKSNALGWTGTFMKQGIALFLLYLHEGDWNGQGIRTMANQAKREINFSLTEYQKGISDTSPANENDLFHDIFAQWKQMTPMAQDVKESVIKKITTLLKKRTEGIMEANRRNYYGECAAFIAALGEVKESLGEANAKQKLMASYKEKYSRRRAFHSEMKMYGWKG